MSTEIDVQDLSAEKLSLIKQTVAKGATDLELELFLHACRRTGLDPLMKQIYCIKRGANMAIQTGIDGYRLIADRTGQYAGSGEPQYSIGMDGYPEVASVTVTKLVGSTPCLFSASARWDEYRQESSPMWKKMPFLMLGKCAEALALRKAFPAELSGVYTHEEMMQADTEQPSRGDVVMANKQTAHAKIAELAKEMQEPVRQGSIDAAAPSRPLWLVPHVGWMQPHCGKSADELDEEALLKYLNYYEGKLQKEPHSRYREEWETAHRALVEESMTRESAQPRML